MNAKEAALLCRYVKACCPQQKFDEYTPDAWFDLLGDLSFHVAKKAAAAVAKKQPFVAPSEIRTAAARISTSVRNTILAEIEGHTHPCQLGEWNDDRKQNLAELIDTRIENDYYDLSRIDITAQYDWMNEGRILPPRQQQNAIIR